MKNITNSKVCLNCKGCCYFLSKNQAKLAPFFTQRELRDIDNKKLKKINNNFLQAKIVKSKKYKKRYVCIFLNEDDYRCKIYRNRPIDCMLWPFVVGYDKKKKKVFLWVVDKDWCPAVDIKNIKKFGVVDDVVEYLEENKYFEEIRNNERPAWPYANYQIKLKEINLF